MGNPNPFSPFTNPRPEVRVDRDIFIVCVIAISAIWFFSGLAIGPLLYNYINGGCL